MKQTVLAIAIIGLSFPVLAQDADPLAGNEGIPNYYRLREDIATAGQPTDEALADIQKAGFKAVLNLRTEQEGSLEEKPKVEGLGMEYYNIPIGRDGFSPAILEQFQEILAKSNSLPLNFGVRLKGGDYGLVIRRDELWLLKRVGGTDSVLASTVGDFPITDLLRIQVELDSGAIRVRLGERELLFTTDSGLAGSGRVVREFVSKPDPNRITRLKSSLKALRDSREKAFFGIVQYSEDEAQASVRLLDTVLENAKVFVVQRR